MSRTFSAALVTARRVLRRCFAVRTCSSSLTRIHQDLLHHTMCPLGTSFLSFSRMVTSSSLSRFPGALLALSLVFMRFLALSLFLLTLSFGLRWPSFFPEFPPGGLTQLVLFLHLGFVSEFFRSSHYRSGRFIINIIGCVTSGSSDKAQSGPSGRSREDLRECQRLTIHRVLQYTSTQTLLT